MKNKIKKAIISLSDKSEIRSILKVLKKYNIKIIIINFKDVYTWYICVLS